MPSIYEITITPIHLDPVLTGNVTYNANSSDDRIMGQVNEKGIDDRYGLLRGDIFTDELMDTLMLYLSSKTGDIIYLALKSVSAINLPGKYHGIMSYLPDELPKNCESMEYMDRIIELMPSDSDLEVQIEISQPKL